jgi:hypothetical protein
MTAPRLFRRLARPGARVRRAARAGGFRRTARAAPEGLHRSGARGVAAAMPFVTDPSRKIGRDRQRAARRLRGDGPEPGVPRWGTPPAGRPPRGRVKRDRAEERAPRRLRACADRFQAAHIGLLAVSALHRGFGDLLLTPLDGG